MVRTGLNHCETKTNKRQIKYRTANTKEQREQGCTQVEPYTHHSFLITQMVGSSDEEFRVIQMIKCVMHILGERSKR